MAIPKSKSELLEAINKNFDLLFKELQDVPKEKVFENTLEGHIKGEMMSMHNLLSYLTGWNELVLKWIELDRKKKNIDFPETGFKWNELGKLAQKFYLDYEEVPYKELLKEFEKIKKEIVEVVLNKSDEDLYGRNWYGKHTMGRMIQLNTSSPYTNARARIRKWKKVYG